MKILPLIILVLSLLILFDMFGTFDWLIGFNGHLPYWPSWMCWLLTRHKLKLKYANYNADTSGKRCFCGKHWRDN